MEQTTPNTLQSSDDTRKRAINLFKYLRELTKLSSKVVRNIDEYDNVLYFSDVPNEKECFTPAWGIKQQGKEDIWLEVKKPKLQSFPSVPGELKPWVKKADLENATDIPNLFSRIPVPESETNENYNGTEIESNDDQLTQFLELDDYPHLTELWEKYLEEKWLPWAEEHTRIKTVQQAYQKLHAIYQQKKRQGETYELVLGFGLLTWTTPHSQQVKRHLFTAQASVELDDSNGTLRVVPAADGLKVSLEQDMLEVSERPCSDVQIVVEEKLKEIDEDIWNVTAIKDIIRRWINPVSSDGIYIDKLDAPTDFSTSPIVSYTPAVILRKRSEHSLLITYKRIIEQLESGVKIPTGVNRTVTITEDNESADSIPGTSGKGDDYQDTLFPLPSNDEQIQIIENLRHRQGVLVQGPPGTGKSHTIVNLICHLLATGKRVLVTSQTTKALKVLKGMLPKEMAALCVSLLGNDLSSMQGLEESVQGITNRQQDWNTEKNKTEIVELRKKRDTLKRREAVLRRQICEVRENETYHHRICDGAYLGTAQSIAGLISTEHSRYSWLNTRVEMDTQSPLSNNEAMELLELHRKLDTDQVSEAMMSFISPEELPLQKKFEFLNQTESNAQDQFNSFVDVRDTETYKELADVAGEYLIKLKKGFTQLLYTVTNLLNKDQQWVTKAVNDIISENDSGWRELFNTSTGYLNGLIDKARDAEERQINLPDDYDRSIVKCDAIDLLNHFEQGGSTGIPLFRPKQVKESWYLIKELYVDGHRCDNPESLKKLISILEVDERLDRLWSLWSSYTGKVKNSRPLQVGVIEGYCKTLEEVLNLHSQLIETKETCASMELPQPAWHVIEEIKQYIHTIEAVESEKNLMQARVVFDETEQKLRDSLEQPNVHQAINKIHQAVTDRDVNSYGNALTELNNLLETR